MATQQNDLLVVQRGTVSGAGGDDTFILSGANVEANAQITITDTLGVNTLQLIGGLSIVSSIVMNNTAQLTLSNGAVVTIMSASNFTYEIGGNPLLGQPGIDQTYEQFVTTTLGTTVPATGQNTGGSVIIPADTTSPTLVAGAASVNEGQTATFALAHASANTTYTYNITGVEAADVTGGLLTGTVTTDANGAATISVATVADRLTEGAQTITVSLPNSAMTASTTLNDTSLDNIAPVATAATLAAAEDGAVLSGQLVATDADGDAIAFELTAPVEGLTVNADGTYTFNPLLNTAAQALKYDSAPLVITANYTATDNAPVPGSTPSTLTITVTPKPLSYSLVGSAAFVEEGSTVQYTLVASEAVTTAVSGTIQVVAGDGTTGQTAANDFGSGSLNPVTVTIAAGGTVSTAMTLTPSNDSATESPEAYSVKGTITGQTIANVAGEVRDPSTVGGLGQTFNLTTGVDTIPGLTGSAGSTGTDGNDTINATTAYLPGTSTKVNTLSSLDNLNGGLGTNKLVISDTDAAGYTLSTGITLANIQEISISGAAAVTADITPATITGVTNLAVTQATTATLKAAATTAINVSGVTGGAKEVFVATFAGTEAGDDTTIVFDGVTSTLAAAVGGAALAADFTADYNAAAGANWVAVASGASVTFTAKVPGAKTDVVSGDFVVTANTADTVAVTVTAATPTTQGTDSAIVDGGSSQTVSVAQGAVTVGATTVTAGAISVTNAAQGASAIAIDGGAAVTVNTTGSTGGKITVGQGGAATDLPTGVVGVTSNHKAVAATDATLGNITVTGGSTVTVNQVADTSKAPADKTGATLTQGDVKVTAGTATTSVTVTQAKSTLEVLAADAVAAVTETASVKFGALKAGDKIILGTTVANDTVDASEIVFTAAKDLTAAEVAQAFANLTNPDAQAGGNVTNGNYSFKAGTSSFTTWTSGVANGDTVVFTSTSADKSVDDLVVDLVNSGTSVEAVVTPGATGSGATAAKTGVLGVANGKVVIDDNATAASITSVTVDGYAASSTIGATNNVTKLANLSLANSGSATAGTLTGDMTVNVGASLATLGLTLNNVQGAVTLTGAGLKTLNITATGANSSTALSAAAAETMTIAGDKSLTLSSGTFTALKSITVSGSAGAVFDSDEAGTLTSFNTSATSGAVTAFIDGTKATYTGGGGIDTVTLVTGTSLTKAIDLGDGDDTLVFGVGVTTSSAALNGGNGTADTLSMSTANAASLDDTMQTFYSGFERLLINDAGAAATVIDLANLGFTSYVTTKGSAGTLTLNNLASNGTVVITTAPTTGYTVGVKDAATGGTDVLNAVLSSSGNLGAGTLTAANVETINISTVDTEVAAVQTKNSDSITLTADKATTVNLTGSADLILTLTTSSEVTLVDAASTVMSGGLTMTANGAAAGTEVRGGSGNDNLTASGELDVLKGNAGNDIFNLTDLTSAYGGTGADTFNFAVNTNLTKVSTVYELGSGDVFNLKDVYNAGGASAVVTKFYAAGAQYNPATTTDVAGKVNAALVQTGEGEATWFNHLANTYIVIDANDTPDVAAGQIDTYQAGKDIVIEIVGTYNLGTDAAFNMTTGTLEIL